MPQPAGTHARTHTEEEEEGNWPPTTGIDGLEDKFQDFHAEEGEEREGEKNPPSFLPSVLSLPLSGQKIGGGGIKK